MTKFVNVIFILLKLKQSITDKVVNQRQLWMKTYIYTSGQY